MDLRHALGEGEVCAERLVDFAQPGKQAEALDRDAQARRAAGAIGREGPAIARPRQRAPRRRAEDGARARGPEQAPRVAITLPAAGRRGVEQPERHVHADDARGAREVEDRTEVARHRHLGAGAAVGAGALGQHDHPACATAVDAGHEIGHVARRQARRGGWPATSASWTMVTSETMSKTGRPVSRWMSAVYGGMLVHSSTMAPMSG